ncbi:MULTISPECIES: DUF6024 family protein [unclassified Pantoea]|uniref:DUF6024 family protein n=1 Tax=unclassified Pantoea TaxID=2630326 RepID=UPI0023DB0DBC|nr:MULTISPECIES: DUF6024 family protein [unclassified Pantoea]MDF2041543.1 DUF6024 family protein [Pantoea sp. Cr_R14]MDF2070018.1 DUF6024 family protein [Pantoea sp. Cr_R13]MDF2078676.1 DUF6024 family protein [Pantoea sp. Cr_R21]
MAHSPLSSETSAEARHRLRLALSRFYRLEQFDLFFAPSLHVAQVLLSQLFLRQEQARNQQRYALRYPITELSNLPAVPLIAGSIMLVPHIELPNGRVRPLQDCQNQGVTEASESFASVLHQRLIDESHLFVTRLDRHAEICSDLVLVALRTHDFSTLVRSELRLFEQGLTLNATYEALRRFDDPLWRPYNAATVDALSLSSPLPLNSCHQPGLPFASFNVPASLISALSDADDVVKWPQLARLQLNANVRGSGKKSVNMTHHLSRRLQFLLSAGGKSEKASVRPGGSGSGPESR